jgi:hypothetical protein
MYVDLYKIPSQKPTTAWWESSIGQKLVPTPGQEVSSRDSTLHLQEAEALTWSWQELACLTGMRPLYHVLEKLNRPAV